MIEAYGKEELMKDIVDGIEKDKEFPMHIRIQLEAICERYIIINEDSTYSIAGIKGDRSKGWSLKFGNVFFKFKSCMGDILTITKNAAGLDCKLTFKNIMLVIDIITRIFKLTTITLNEEKCKVLLALHELDAYDSLVDVSKIRRGVQVLVKEDVSEEDIRNALAELSEIGCVRITDDGYALNEIVCYSPGR